MEVWNVVLCVLLNATVSQAVTFTAGAPAASTSSLVASPNSLVANGTAHTTITTTARDAQGNLITGTSVSLSASGGNNTFGAATGITDATGVWTTTLKSTAVQTETITATLNGNVTLTTSVTFTVGPASSTTSTFKANPASAVANGTAAITATLRLKDAQSHPIPGVTPTFAASGASTTMSAVNATNASGVSAVTFKTTLAQNENAQVSAAGLNFVAPMVFVAGPPAPANSSVTISPSSVVADGNTPATLSMHLVDQYNNLVKNLGIGFQATGGAGPFSLSSVVTDASGNATNTMVSSTQGTSTVIVYAAGVALTTTLTSTAPTPYCTGNPNYFLGRLGTNTPPSAITMGDWNGDGRPDFAYADNNNQLVSTPILVALALRRDRPTPCVQEARHY